MIKSLAKECFATILLVAIGVVFPYAASAQEVTVTGIGMDRATALNDAKRAAVRQVVGTYIDSRTIVRDARVALDEIYAKSYGFVRNINILMEEKMEGAYRIKARIDVNTQPDSELLGKIHMVTALNDPRIAVKISGDLSEGTAYCKGVVVEMLLQQGFSHVVDTSTDGGDDTGEVDYLVMGSLKERAAPILLPKYADYTNETSEAPSVNTGLSKAIVTIDGKIKKVDTQEIIGEFHSEADAIRNSDENAVHLAIENLAGKVAEAVQRVFARQSSSVNGNVKIIARATQSGLAALETKLRCLTGVENVYFRSYSDGKGIIQVDTDMKPSQLFQRLNESMNLFLEKTSSGVLEISVNE